MVRCSDGFKRYITVSHPSVKFGFHLRCDLSQFCAMFLFGDKNKAFVTALMGLFSNFHEGIPIYVVKKQQFPAEGGHIGSFVSQFGNLKVDGQSMAQLAKQGIAIFGVFGSFFQLLDFVKAVFLTGW